jgi:hypothetical protein
LPRIKTKPVQWKLTIDETLAARIELKLADLAGGKPLYGARSALISFLLRDWLAGTNLAPSANNPNLILALEEQPAS